MSQKVGQKKVGSSNTTNVTQKGVTSQTKTVKKKSEDNKTLSTGVSQSRAPVSSSKTGNVNKSESNKAKPVTSVSDKTKTKIKDNKTNVTTTTNKTNNSRLNDAKSVTKQTKPSPTVVNRNARVKNASLVKTVVPNKATNNANNKSVSNKESDKSQNKIAKKDNTTDRQKSGVTKTKAAPEIIESSKPAKLQVEDQAGKESSDEQYASLATLESYSSFKQSHKSSESILAEPPSVCDTDIDDMINNISENQNNDDFPSDYCDDFEDYESDFEEDDEEIDDSDEEEGDWIQDRKNEVESDKPLNETKEYYRSEIPVEREGMNRTVSHKNESKVETKYKPITESIKSAKMRTNLEVKTSKSRKRSKELLEIIKLNEISFVDFDLPPINYDIFIKTFGRKDAKQVSCQTSDRQHREIQTDLALTCDKWTQNPSFTRIVSGNEEQLNENDLNEELIPKVDSFELVKFVNKAEVLLSAIIDMEADNNYIANKRSLPKGGEQFSSSISVIKCIPLAKMCPIVQTFTNSLYVFCVQNVTKIIGSTEKCVISVWSLMGNRSEPVRMLICRSHIAKAFSRHNLVFGAMIDGSVAIWDLKEHSVYDKELVIESHKYRVRTPSYNCVLTSKSHNSAVIAICELMQIESNDLTVQFGTVDESGLLLVWSVSEAKEESNESVLSQTNDYRITQISSINLIDKATSESSSLKITAFECQLNDWSNFYCGTDTGTIIRCTRVQESVATLPKQYLKSDLNSDWSQVSVISFSKCETNKFLVAFSDGIVSHYSISNELPLIVFTANERPIVEMKWIPNTCDKSFIILNNSNQILIWDLNDQQMKPRIKFKHSNDRALSMCFWHGLKTFLVFGCDHGNSLIFEFNYKPLE